MRIVSKVISRLSHIDDFIWRIKQPLTKKPSNTRSVVSDLFLWRKNHEWRTFFELTDIASLFNAELDTGVTEVRVFDQCGNLVSKHFFKPPRHSRQQLDISKLADSCKDEIGTFCVLHAETPEIIVGLGSNLAERGYVSYCYKDSPIRSYIHGNLDAVGVNPSGSLEFLAGTSFLKRQYRLQYEFQKDSRYELMIVNASAKMQSVQCELFNLSSEKSRIKHRQQLTCSKLSSKHSVVSAKVRPGACHIFNIGFDKATEHSVRVILTSKLVMLRPIVFQFQNNKMDVFHG